MEGRIMEDGHWSLVIGHWSLVIGHWSLVIGHWSLVIGRRMKTGRATRRRNGAERHGHESHLWDDAPRRGDRRMAGSKPTDSHPRSGLWRTRLRLCGNKWARRAASPCRPLNLSFSWKGFLRKKSLASPRQWFKAEFRCRNSSRSPVVVFLTKTTSKPPFELPASNAQHPTSK